MMTTPSKPAPSAARTSSSSCSPLPADGPMTLAAETQTIDEASAALTPDARPGAYVCVSVTDTGTGIQPEQLERIFDPFFTTKPFAASALLVALHEALTAWRTRPTSS